MVHMVAEIRVVFWSAKLDLCTLDYALTLKGLVALPGKAPSLGSWEVTVWRTLCCAAG